MLKDYISGLEIYKWVRNIGQNIMGYTSLEVKRLDTLMLGDYVTGVMNVVT